MSSTTSHNECNDSVAVTAATRVSIGVFNGAVYGALAGIFLKKACPGGPMIQARYYATSTGVYVATNFALGRITEMSHVQSSMASAFCGGAVFTQLRGGGGLLQVMNGLISALSIGAFYNVEQMVDARKQRKEGPKELI